MLRLMNGSLLALILAAALVLPGCGGGEPEEKEKRDTGEVLEETIERLEGERDALAMQIASALDELASARGELEETRSELESSRQQLERAERRFEQTAARLADTENVLGATRESLGAAGLDSLKQVHQDLTGSAGESEDKQEKKGWPLPIKILVVLALVVIVILFFQRITSDDDEEEDLLDESFVEENDLGTIHYPAQAESATEESGEAGESPPESRPEGEERKEDQ